MLQSKVSWKDGMAFEAELEGLHFDIDADPEFGGRGLGPKPKGLLLTSLVGCTGMDVVAILGKMRLSPSKVDVSAEADLTEDHPKRFAPSPGQRCCRSPVTPAQPQGPCQEVRSQTAGNWPTALVEARELRSWIISVSPQRVSTPPTPVCDTPRGHHPPGFSGRRLARAVRSYAPGTPHGRVAALR